jgi:hypothetical protein
MMALAVIGALVSGCAWSASEASRSISFDKNSAKAVVILGAANHRVPSAPEDGVLDRPNSLATHWQEYDRGTMLLVPDGALMTSLRHHNAWESTTLRDSMVQVLEVEPGDYALIAVSNTRTVTSFFPLNERSGLSPGQAVSPYRHGLAMKGEVDPKKHFHFSIEPGQIVYIGHFDFLHPGGGKHRIIDINYSLDAAAGRAALQDYPGISGDMVTLNLALPTETAAR